MLLKNKKPFNRSRFALLLMAISLVLFFILQILWIRTEYKSAVDSFSQESNLVFRSTIYHIADSLFVSDYVLAGDTSKHSDDKLISVYNGQFNKDSANNYVLTSLNQLMVNSPDSMVQNTKINIIKAFPNETGKENNQTGEDSVCAKGRVATHFFFMNFNKTLRPDSLMYLYKKTINGKYDKLETEVLVKDFTFNAKPFQMRSMAPDSLPFTTSFIPVGNKMYAINFLNAPRFIITDLLPQIGFSLLISIVMLISFFMIKHSMVSQHKLIEHKNAFIANMTHELKTPVATVGVALEALKSFDVLKDTEKSAQYIDIASRELSRLTLITDKILKTSVIDFDAEIRQNQSVVYLKPLLEKVYDSFRLTAERKKQAFELETGTRGLVMGNAEHIEQMFYNLFDNALKYGSPCPLIKVSLWEDSQWVCAEIRDRGKGIHESFHTRIFERFFRVPSGNVHDVKGYGLGLHYVAGVVKAHDGKIIVESSPGNGAAFIVKFHRYE